MTIRRSWRAIGVTAALATVTTTAVGLGVSSASGAETTRSETHASSRFLAGSLSVPLVAIADNDDGESTVRAHEPLLSAPPNPLLQLGVANQIAVAATDGVAQALTGAVDSGSGVAPADLSLSLDSVTGGTALQGVLEDLTLNLGAISSAAAVDASKDGAIADTCTDPADPQHCRDYRIAGGALTFEAPLVGDLVTQIVAALGPVTDQVNGLAGPGGLLAQALQAVTALTDVIPIADLDLNATVSLTNLETAVRTVLADPLDDGIVRIDLTTGEITADVDKLVTAATGKSLNDQDPNTEVLTKAVIDELISHLVTLLGRLPGQVLDVVTGLVDAAEVNIGANICLLSTGTAPDCRIAGIPNTGTGIALDIHGTIAELLADQGTATLDLHLLGIPVVLPVGDLLGVITPLLRTVTDSIDTGLAPALNGVIGTVTSALEPALDALPQLLSLVINVQEDTTVGGLPGYAQSALKLSVAGALDVELARSEASARLTTVTDPSDDPDPTADPDPSTDPDPATDPDPDPVTDPVTDPQPTTPTGTTPQVDPVPTKVTAGL